MKFIFIALCAIATISADVSHLPQLGGYHYPTPRRIVHQTPPIHTPVTTYMPPQQAYHPPQQVYHPPQKVFHLPPNHPSVKTYVPNFPRQIYRPPVVTYVTPQPAHHELVHHAPVYHTPVHHALVHHTPVHHTPVHHTRVYQTPVHHATVHHEPAYPAPIDREPVYQRPVHHTPVTAYVATSVILPPMVAYIPPTAILDDDGYHYKTVKKIRYRYRRH